ncbi:MAG: oligosaccharide flippase family protein, partial [Burkholderiales bacterium]
MAGSNATTLKQKVLRAGGWSLAGYGLSQIIRFGSSLIMTRLLVPEMFGVMAIATMVTVILGLLSDVGVHQNIIQSKRGDDSAFLDTAWTVQIIRGGILWLLAVAVSAAIYFGNAAGLMPRDSVYANGVLPYVVAASAFSAVISGFQSTKLHIAYRRFEQRRRIEIELASQIVSLLVMIVIGAATRSIWALVTGGLVAALMTTILSHAWMTGHSNRLRWESEAVREVVHFGRWVFVSSAIGVFASRGDRLLLGAFVDSQVLGLFSIAALIVNSAQGVLSKLLTTVSLPAFSEIARTEPRRLREIYYKMRVPGDVALLFPAGFLFAAGQLVVDLLYDKRYAAAGGMLQILALSLFTFRYLVAHQLYLAVGIPRYLAIVNIVRFASLYVLVPVMFHFGGTSAAIWGVALHDLATVPFIYYFNAKLGVNDV